MSTHDWHYAIGTQQYGPVSFQTLWSMASAGQLTSDNLVWREGMSDWRPAGDTPEFAAAFAPRAGTAVSDAGTSYDLAPPQPTAAPAAAWPSPSHAYGHGQPAGPYGPPYMHGAAGGVLPYGTYMQAGGPYAGTVHYAGFWIRFLAAFIDSLITGVAGCVVGGVTGGVIGAVSVASGSTPGGGLSQETNLLIQVVSNLLGIVIGWLYSAFMESSSNQATLGKMAVGIRVTDVNGQRISFARATGRHFGKIVSGLILLIGYIMAAFDEQKRSLHDRMAGTLVTYKNA